VKYWTVPRERSARGGAHTGALDRPGAARRGPGWTGTQGGIARKTRGGARRRLRPRPGVAGSDRGRRGRAPPAVDGKRENIEWLAAEAGDPLAPVRRRQRQSARRVNRTGAGRAGLGDDETVTIDDLGVHQLTVARGQVEKRLQPPGADPLRSLAGGERQDPGEDDPALAHGVEGAPVKGRCAGENEDGAEGAEKEARAEPQERSQRERGPALVADLRAWDPTSGHPEAPSTRSTSRPLAGHTPGRVRRAPI